MIKFRDSTPYDKRLALAQQILTKHPEHVPIILESYGTGAGKVELSKNKFIMPLTHTVGQFLHKLHTEILVKSKETIFLFCNESVLLPTSLTFDVVYSKYKDKDGFIYLTVTKENTFG